MDKKQYRFYLLLQKRTINNFKSLSFRVQAATTRASATNRISLQLV